MSNTKENEKVLCVSAEVLWPYHSLEGFMYASKGVVGHLKEIIQKHGVFRRRGDVEDDRSYQQIIPQIAMVAENKLLMHVIKNTTGEGRLANKYSIFLGGHMNEADGKDLTVAAMREFKEELYYPFKVEMEIVGLVNFNDSPVNKVHFGVVFLFQGERAVLPRKTNDEGVSKEDFVAWKIARLAADGMTAWSKTALPCLESRYAEKSNE